MESNIDQPQEKIPNATLILVLGISSIVACCCQSFVGLGLGIAALILANKALKIYYASPSSFEPASFANVRAGRICAIIGIIISAISVILLVWATAVFGWDVVSDKDKLREALENLAKPQ